jgi:hypothetical protein
MTRAENLAFLDDRIETLAELAAAREDVARFRSALARPEVVGAWAEKIGWQLRAAERSVKWLSGVVSEPGSAVASRERPFSAPGSLTPPTGNTNAPDRIDSDSRGAVRS